MKQTVLADLKQTKNNTLTCKKPKKNKTTKNKRTIEEPLNTPQPNTEPNQTKSRSRGTGTAFFAWEGARKWGKVDFPELKLCFSLWFTWLRQIVREQKQTSRVSLVTSGMLNFFSFLSFSFFFNPANRKDMQKNQPRQSRRLGWWTETYPKNVWFAPHQKWIKPVAKSCHEL